MARRAWGFWRVLVEEVGCRLGFEELVVIWTHRIKKVNPDVRRILVPFGRK